MTHHRVSFHIHPSSSMPFCRDDVNDSTPPQLQGLICTRAAGRFELRSADAKAIEKDHVAAADIIWPCFSHPCRLHMVIEECASESDLGLCQACCGNGSNM